ncbi:hypothetical protein [Williamsia sp. CHRR-6]|uniref:hypothetical protein n=1 Tax=Williamsia sp. CHRR-6 TaxID=2835871 RepID=UPI001BD95688|nr:hypothetical protein [Williamsia sp. CHRR-6]MBT0566347.1 hypothetical protein [Williamsia sp. CHRR-6]
MRDSTNRVITAADQEQARVFIEQLEVIATRLEQQVEALEASSRMPGARTSERLMTDARARRLELYETRSHIDALTSRYLIDRTPV